MKNENLKYLAGSKILVTGASGFSGGSLVNKLALAGGELRAIARNSSQIEHLASLPIKWFRGDVYDPSLIKEAVKDVGYIFHVAAAFRQAKVSQDEYRKVHVESTQLLAREALNSKSFKRFIHVSTMGVHGHIDNPPGDEQTSFAPGDIYQETKAEGELWLHEFARANSLPYTVIRPTGIYGPGDGRLFKLFKIALWPVVPVLGFGKCLYHLIYVDDLADAMIHAAVEPRALGESFLIGNADSITLEDIFSIICRTYRKRLRIVRIPVQPVFAAAFLCELLCKPFGVEPPLYRRRVAFFTKDRSFKTDKMRNVLGFYPKKTNEEGIIETAKWYAEQGWIKL